MIVFAILISLFLGSVGGFSTKSQPCTYSKDETRKPALANAIFITASLLLGSITSLVSGFLGIKIATYANARTTLQARKGVGKVFITTFWSGAVMGFWLLQMDFWCFTLQLIYSSYTMEKTRKAFLRLLLVMVLVVLPWLFLGKLVGGIYTKAADVGADLVGKVERNIPEDNPRNPAVIADNVGDIAGMRSDPFGSYAESSCIALVVASISSSGINYELIAMLYHLLLSSIDIIVCLITILFATGFFEIKAVKEIEPALKRQLIISTDIVTVAIGIASWIVLSSIFTIFALGEQKIVKNWELFFCAAIGLWAGLVIGFAILYKQCIQLQDVANSCRTGAVTNVTVGLALGYKT